MPQCRFKKPNGTQCKNNAVKGMRFCYLSSHCGTAPWRERVLSLLSSHVSFWISAVSLFLALFTFWPRVDASVSNPREPGNASTSSIEAKNIGLIPLMAVTIRWGFKQSCTRGTQWCTPPLIPRPDRYKDGLFTMGLRALGTRDLGIDQHFSYPIDNIYRLEPSKAYPDLTEQYIDAAIVIDYEVPLIHWHRTKVFPMYTGRHGEWEWG
jgi:hypothetical protein